MVGDTRNKGDGSLNLPHAEQQLQQQQQQHSTAQPGRSCNDAANIGHRKQDPTMTEKNISPLRLAPPAARPAVLRNQS
jgi:hypothetical protein